ncbi:MAG TPA: hypothetical protein VNM34_14915 [Verrucomicrobiae bacterium]|nr:hypothetical protein [Verrucomicrobiae bacterium]
MPTLRELDARFLKLLDPAGESWRWEGVELADSDGVLFLCPKCFAENAGPVGTHSIVCWWRHVPQSVYPVPGRWKPQGTGLDDLTFAPGVPALPVSVLLKSGCGWHGFVRDGRAD